VWGEVVLDDRTEAVYYVHWTLGEVDRHGAHIDLIVGAWGDGTSSADRKAISLEFRRTERGPEFMVIDATRREIAASSLVGSALDRVQVIGTPLASQVFGMVDSIWVGDPRIGEISGAA
jgi:hypothetical protein